MEKRSMTQAAFGREQSELVPTAPQIRPFPTGRIRSAL